VAFVSLGCPKNLVDSEKMLGTLREAGFELVSEAHEADAVVVNTCGFLEASKEESLEVINDALARKSRGELRRVVVAGCLVQRHRAKLLEWAPGIDSMIGVFDRDHIIDAVAGGPALRAAGRPALRAGGGGGAALRAAAVQLDGDDAAAASSSTNGDPEERTTRGVVPPFWIAGNALQAAQARGLDTVGLTVNGADGMGIGYFEDDAGRFRLTPRHWAYLRVSEGCNQKCAFCTIPSIRGKMRSKPLDRIVSEARALLADGAFELNLIGQDTTSYGYDVYGERHEGTQARTHGARRAGAAHHAGGGLVSVGDRSYPGDLIGLLASLDDVAGEFGGGWMRLMYVYPTHFTDEMIDAIASLPNIVKYIDIPLQHMSDRMLKAMRRNISRAQQEELLHKLRERIPGLAIRTTFITGFPGETEGDHETLLEFIDDFGFDMLGVFRYSPEAGTPAGRMDRDPDLHVPDEVKARREQEIMLLQQEIAFENAQYVAEQRSQFDVLIDRAIEVDDGGRRYVGRCYHQAPQVDPATYVESDEPLTPGELVRCTIVDAEGYDFIARPTEQLERRVRLKVVG